MNGSQYCLITGKTLSWKDVTGKPRKALKNKLLLATKEKYSNQLREAIYTSEIFNYSEKEMSKRLSIPLSILRTAINVTAPSFGKMDIEQIEQLIKTAQSLPRKMPGKYEKNVRIQSISKPPKPPLITNEQHKRMRELMQSRNPFEIPAKSI